MASASKALELLRSHNSETVQSIVAASAQPSAPGKSVRPYTSPPPVVIRTSNTCKFGVSRRKKKPR